MVLARLAQLVLLVLLVPRFLELLVTMARQVELVLPVPMELAGRVLQVQQVLQVPREHFLEVVTLVLQVPLGKEVQDL